MNKIAGMAAAVLLSGLVSCSDLARENPFDPNSPEYNKNDVGLNALAGDQRVYIYWNPLDYTDLDGFNILRTVLGEADTVALNDSLLKPGILDYLDISVENGVTYSYMLHLVLRGSSEKILSKGDLATPGNAYPWITTEHGQTINLFTPDFRDELYHYVMYFYGVQDMQVSSNGYELWALDGGDHRTSRFHILNEPQEIQGTVDNVAAFRLSHFSSDLWLGATNPVGRISHLNADGSPLGLFYVDATPTSIAVNYLNGDLWVGSAEGRIFMARQGNPPQELVSTDFIRPGKICIGPSSSYVWVLDTGSNRLFMFEGQNMLLNLHVFNTPTDIECNESGTVCWVADPSADLVYEIGLGGKVTSRIEGLGEPHRLAYNFSDHSVYVSGRLGKVSRVLPGGAVAWQVSGFDTPGQIAFRYRLR